VHEHDLPLSELVWFAGWLVAVVVLFSLALSRSAMRCGGPFLSTLRTAGAVVLVTGVAVLANVALSLHDVHVDLTRAKVYTPSERALEVADAIDRPVALHFYYRTGDAAGERAKRIVEIMGRRNRLLHVVTADPDKRPTLARNHGVKLYNAAVLEADGRRITVQSADEAAIAIGIQRVLRQQVVEVCFAEGHGEYPVDGFEFHTHFEGMPGHEHGQGASASVVTGGHGVGRLRRALESIGYDVRRIVPAREGAIPPSCTVVVAAGPRTTYLPGESDALGVFLRGGGAALLMLDLGFVLEPRLERLLGDLGLRLPQAVVVDPDSHYETDPEMVAVTGYPSHPITRRVSFTFYPGARPLNLVTPAGNLEVTALASSSAGSQAQPVRAAAARVTGLDEALGTPGAPRPHVLAAAVEGTLPGGGRPLRAVVVGDSDFASNSFVPYMANGELALGMIRWLAREEDEVPIAARIPVPPLILLTADQMRRLFLALVVAPPLAVVALGTLVWWRRR